MPKIEYVSKNFNPASLAMIENANEIIAEYTAKGFVLTLRQLYYRFVSKDLLPNTQQNYKRLGSVINDARLAGLVDWNAIEDRTRSVEELSHWDSPASIIEVCASSYRVDKWRDQKYRPEVWIEKQALAGVFERICRELDIPYLACKGYNSASVVWRSGMRLKRIIEDGQTPLILHFGDHDPSGLDMTRDISDRMGVFMADVRVERMALNMAQVEEYNPPPNPTKLTDSRAHGENGYIAIHGHESWELDALPPDVLNDLVRTEVEKLRDDDQWQEDVDTENEYRATLRAISNNFTDVHQYTIDQGWLDKETEAGEGADEEESE